MLVPVEWLKDYVSVDVDTREFVDRMIMSGSNVETVEHFGTGMDKVVVGYVVKKEKHPDADRLSVCSVDIGEEAPIQIVCGALNVEAGQKVPVALHNSRIPGPLHGQPKQEGGVKITKGKLRGVESMGMICAASELGFDEKVVPVAHKDGIWVLPEDAPVGAPIEQAMGLVSDVVDFEITPNRPDCLSMVGMAREAAVTFGSQLSYPDSAAKAAGDRKAADFISVEIKDQEACKRYSARVVTDVKIGPSPWWMQKRLMYAGMRPINNIVDITNFVMLEYGQPLHAFDIRQIEGGKIVVERAADGEKFTTLDGTERELTSDMLLIKDAVKGVAIAGVMGGLNSEIEPDTSTILIESANFDADSIRLTSKALKLRTEASARYEKGIDPNLCEEAANRVCRLIELLGAGTVQPGAVDVYPAPVQPWTVDVRTARINKLLGIDLSAAEMKSIFESLEMKVAGDEKTMKVTPPTVRLDMVGEVDFAEEVARMYGYDKLPVTLPKGSNTSSLGEAESLRRLVRSTLCAMGANEIQTYSFVSPRDADKVRLDDGTWETNYVRLINPLGEEQSVMRTILMPEMLETLGRNSARGVESVRAYEIGTTFSADLFDEEALPDEEDAISIGMYGADNDFFTLKGMVTELLGQLGIRRIRFIPEKEYGVFHPGRCARIVIPTKDEERRVLERPEPAKDGASHDELQEDYDVIKGLLGAMNSLSHNGSVELGIMGEVHPDVAEAYGIDGRCCACELFFDVIARMAQTKVKYKPLPKYPSTSRDIALLVDEAVQVGDIESVIRQSGGGILEDVTLFDIYRGRQIEEGKKSVAFTLVYRAEDKTLTDEDVAAVHEKMLQVLKDRFHAALREM